VNNLLQSCVRMKRLRGPGGDDEPGLITLEDIHAALRGALIMRSMCAPPHPHPFPLSVFLCWSSFRSPHAEGSQQLALAMSLSWLAAFLLSVSAQRAVFPVKQEPPHIVG
jgi:hypothetical protein